MSERVRILGLDPGLRNTGWGVITVEGTKLSYVACGVVTSDGDLDLALRLKQLHDRLTEVIRTWTPDEVSVEETFVNKDAQATLKLGQARAMSLLVPALHGLPVAEYGGRRLLCCVHENRGDRNREHRRIARPQVAGGRARRGVRLA